MKFAVEIYASRDLAASSRKALVEQVVPSGVMFAGVVAIHRISSDDEEADREGHEIRDTNDQDDSGDFARAWLEEYQPGAVPAAKSWAAVGCCRALIRSQLLRFLVKCLTKCSFSCCIVASRAANAKSKQSERTALEGC